MQLKTKKGKSVKSLSLSLIPKKSTLLCCFFLFNQNIYSQTTDSINPILLKNNFAHYHLPQKNKRPFLEPTASLLTKLNPVTYISGGLLFVYQNVISEQIQADCQYQISCSENMKQQIKKKGLIAGILSGLNQLGNCSGNIHKDYPDYKINANKKVNNTIE